MTESVVTAVAPRPEWGIAPSNALWYGCVIFEDENGETTYNDDYSDRTQDTPDVDNLAPEGAKILERELRLTPTGLSMIGWWATEEQIIPSE